MQQGRPEIDPGAPAILVVEDDRRMAAFLDRALTYAGYRVAVAEDGERGEKGWLFTGYRQIAAIYLALGDLDRAQTYVSKLQALFAKSSS